MVTLKASSMGSNVPADSNSKTVGQNQHDICTITKITGIIALATQQPNTMLQHCSCMSAHLRFSPSLMNSATFLRSPPCHTTPRPTPTALQRDTTQQLYCMCLTACVPHVYSGIPKTLNTPNRCCCTAAGQLSCTPHTPTRKVLYLQDPQPHAAQRTCFAALLPQLDELCHLFAQPLVVTVKAVIPATCTHAGNDTGISDWQDGAAGSTHIQVMASCS